jgi:hypothetical protein
MIDRVSRFSIFRVLLGYAIASILGIILGIFIGASQKVFVTHDIEEAVLLGDRILVMGVNPGYIKEDIAIALPLPRHKV